MLHRLTRPPLLFSLLLISAIVAVACGSAAPNSGNGDDSADADATEVADSGTEDTDGVPEGLDPFILLLSNWTTDFSRHSIDLSEFISGGPPKDGIRSLDAPKFVSVAEADEFLIEREPVIALELNGDARAYSLGILTRHEIANDVVGGVPVTITFCPLCNSAIVFERELDGTVFDFGVSGVLRNSDLVMYDRQTESWWQQFTGEAVVGELTGALLDVVPSSVVSWADFKAAYPNGQALSTDTGFAIDYGFNPYIGYDSDEQPFLFRGEPDTRLSPIERVVAVAIDDDAVAYPFALLREERVVHDTVGGESIVVFHQSGTASALDDASISESRDVGASGVFRPEAAGRTLTFRAEGDSFFDNETNSEWSILGKAVSGPLAGEELPPVEHGDHFWFAWAAFNPDTRVFGS